MDTFGGKVNFCETLMVGQTPRIRKSERDRFEHIKLYCGCLPCLLMGHLDRHTSIEHVTECGQRVGKDSAQHEATIGLCVYHHFGVCTKSVLKSEMVLEFGPSLAHGRKPFEEHFGDERLVLIPVQNFMLARLLTDPWPEFQVPRRIASDVRSYWTGLLHVD